MSFYLELTKNKPAMIGVMIILFLALIAIFAPYIAPYDPLELNLEERLLPPGTDHLMGTDNLGRDVLSRVLTGTRVSLSMSAVSMA